MRFTPVAATTDGLRYWFVATDSNGNDHVYFCTAKPLHDYGATELAACFDLTPRGNKAVTAWAQPAGPLKPPEAPLPRPQ